MCLYSNDTWHAGKILSADVRKAASKLGDNKTADNLDTAHLEPLLVEYGTLPNVCRHAAGIVGIRSRHKRFALVGSSSQSYPTDNTC